MDKAPVELISEITEFNDLSEYMQDADLDEALAYIIKLIGKPDVPPARAQELIIKLQAISAKFAVLATMYSTLYKDRAGTPNNVKKNVYFTAHTALNELVGALKYSFRSAI